MVPRRLASIRLVTSVGGVVATFESSVEIRRPPEDVFRWFMALDQNAPRIDPEADSASKEPPGETAAGTVFRLRSGSRESRIRFDSVDPNEAIEFSTKLGPLHPTARLSFDATTTGTLLKITGRSNPIGPLRLLEPLANRRGKREWDARLQRIKTDLETT